MNNKTVNVDIGTSVWLAGFIKKADITEEAMRLVLREVLWIACCYNDHNFRPDDLLDKAKKIAKLLKVSDFDADEANALLDRLANKPHQP